MTAVVLACTSAALFGAATVAIRLALRRLPDPALGSFVMVTIGLAVGLLAAVITVRGDEAAPGDLWPYALAGLLAPGASQILFVAAVGAAGPARVSVVVSTAPLFAVAIAAVFLDEPLQLALVAGALLIVGGGLALVGERVRPPDFRALGAALALGATVLFATRDNVVRWLTEESGAAPLAGAVATLAGGAVLVGVYLLTSDGMPAARTLGRAFAVFAPAGVLAGLSYVSLFEAYARGKVSVVSPLVATESLWGVAISVLLLRGSERVGRRLVAGAVLIVAGGALIGAFR